MTGDALATLSPLDNVEEIQARGIVWDVALATIAVGAYTFASLGVFALVPFLRASFHIDAPRVGLLASVQYLVAGFLTFPSARLADRFRPGLIVGLSQMVVASAMVVAWFAPSFSVLLGASALLGLGSGLVNPVSNVLSSGAVSVRRRGAVMSIKQTGVAVGGVCAGIVLPAVALANGWRAALAIPGAVCVIVALWGFSTQSTTPPKRLVLHDGSERVSRFRLGFFAFAMCGVQLALMGYLTVYLVDDRGFSPRLAGFAFAAALASGGIGRVAWGVLSDRLNLRAPLLVAIALVSAAGLVLVPFVSYAGVWMLLPLLGVCSIGWNGVFHALVVESAGPAGVAEATAFAFVFLYGGTIVIPPLLGYGVAAGSWTVFWGLAAAGAMIGAASLMRASSSIGSASR